ncbi:flavodoxin domain-containing protein [Geodermatophilus sabuli]|uniref:Menaquinone-dependent protoporphyrinogen oxidase n=1 Tax=Geodermatophilus sabuli TaxID=1564158 RepID=A0A285EIT2_9ACTN|nr:flavodoxin domain-containing protein [Geodermatophilus sabuli]MBB3083619.1 menaquinone-dependent protoporphyrinogen oxidase [Geodermatophilus sabuli]SNX99049.1 menaquinone-dependent protoporphyrinogen oxidase [Geodermatophilus sabuli]
MTAAGSRVLVVVASRHGATQEIAAALARDLPETPAGKAAGVTAVLAPVESRPDPAPFDAVLLGSAVYAGRWLEPAREYAAAHTAALRERPVWLFSSGPIGSPPFPPDEAHDVAPTSALLGARGHQVFPGRLDLSLLSFGERAMATAMRAPVGDSRDWDLVRRWAEEVAADLTGRPG